MKVTICVMFLLMLGMQSIAEDLVTPSLDDAEQLVARKNWDAALGALAAIAVAERGDRWQKNVEQCVIGRLDGLSEKNPELVDSNIKGLLLKFPILASSRLFEQKLPQWKLAGFRRCYEQNRNKSLCTKKLTSYIKNNSNDIPLILAASQLATANQSPGDGARVIEPALNKPFIEELCQSKTVKRLLSEGKSAENVKLKNACSQHK